MRRVFPDYTYGAGPRQSCFWAETVSNPGHARAEGEIQADVAVIGAGFTGLSAALHLAEGGADVVVLEAQVPGWGASGRNGGFCCLGGSAASDGVLRSLHGEKARREFCTTEAEAVQTVRDLMDRHAIVCDVHSEGETLLAHTPRALAGFEAKARGIERDYGVTPDMVNGGDLARHGMNGPFFGALTTPIGFALNPLKYTLGLTRAAERAGARIFGSSPVLGIESRGGFTLTTPAARVRAGRLVVATNGYSSDDLPAWLGGRYIPTQSNVIVTRPLEAAEIAAQGWSTRQMSYDDRFFLHYFRLMADNRMLFGMRGGLFSSPMADKGMYRTIRRHFERMFPAWAHVETPHSWSGLLSIARDLTPFAGPVPGMTGAVAAISYHGNGVAMASHTGALLADLALDRTPRRTWPAIMRSPPKRFPLGRMRRANFWPLYAWAMLTGK